MATNDFQARDLNGMNIYHVHDKNQTIYFDPFTKTAYIITNAYASSFSTWQLRLPLSIVLGSILILFKLNPFISIGIAILAFVISTIIFHTSYLKKLPIQANFKKPASKGFFKDIADRYPKTVLVIMAVMFGILAIVMIVNQLINKYTDVARTISYVFAAISIVAGILLAYIAQIKDKE